MLKSKQLKLLGIFCSIYNSNPIINYNKITWVNKFADFANAYFSNFKILQKTGIYINKEDVLDNVFDEENVDDICIQFTNRYYNGEVGKHNYWLCLTFNKELTNIQELIYVNGNTFESIKFSW